MNQTFEPIKIGTITLDNPLGLGAGIIKHEHNLGDILKSEAALIEIGSFTKAAREGNSGEVYFNPANSLFSLNAMGLPGPSMKESIEEIAKLVKRIQLSGKKVLISVAGMSASEHFQLAIMASSTGADGVVINLGCPNVYALGDQKPIQSYDIACIREVIGHCETLRSGNPRFTIILKLSPFAFGKAELRLGNIDNTLGIEGYMFKLNNRAFFDSVKLVPEITKALNATNAIDAVITANTLGGVSITHNGVEILNFSDGTSPGKNQGGLAGPILNELMLSQVWNWRELLKPEIAIIACGGIRTGANMKAALDAGASACQIVSAYAQKLTNDDAEIGKKEAASVFSTMLVEYMDASVEKE